jgi:hypothetical protein
LTVDDKTTSERDNDLVKGLLSAYQDYCKDTINRAFQSVGFLIVITGWAATNQVAQTLLRRTSVVLAVTFFLGVGIAAYALGSRNNLKRLLGIRDQLVLRRPEWDAALDVFAASSTAKYGVLGVALVAAACDAAIWLVWSGGATN